jgi:hypothetical protein
VASATIESTSNPTIRNAASRGARARALRRCVAILLLAFVTIVTFVLPANAYHLSGPYWFGNPAPGHCCAQLTVERAPQFYPGDLADFNYGLGVWNNSAALLVFSYVSSSPFIVDDTDNASVSWDGMTNTTENPSNSHQFTSVHIYLNYYYTQHYTANEAGAVAAHEAGHGLGLAHTSGCVLMTPNTPDRQACGVITPQSDDVNGANALY